MIAVKLEGRLGNQLFQYAFIYSTARKLNRSFYIDKSTIDFMVPEYFGLGSDSLFFFDKYIFSIKGYKNIFSFHLKHLFYRLLKNLYQLKETTFDNNQAPAAQLSNLTDKALYKGYFQSEEYFTDYKEDVFKIFTIKEKYKQEFKAILNLIPASEKYITVHIRRGDYTDMDFALPIEYYHKAIESIHSDENYYIFISDDFQFIESEFSYVNRKYLSRHSEIIDLQFLSHADICILSNSSFSWWGAYLNLKQPQIIAPQYWMGQSQRTELPVNIIPYNWQKFRTVQTA